MRLRRLHLATMLVQWQAGLGKTAHSTRHRETGRQPGRHPSPADRAAAQVNHGLPFKLVVAVGYLHSGVWWCCFKPTEA